jgi:hypothetical protein
LRAAREEEQAMGLFDRFGGAADAARPAPAQGDATADEQAIARYRYMLRTAPPETLEQAHAEAFAKLTPEQRRKLLEQLATAAPQGEREAVLRAGDAPGSLARAATRAEVREPGSMERIFGGAPAMGAMPSMGSMFTHTLLGSLAGTVIGSAIAQHFLAAHPPAHGDFAQGGHDSQGADDRSAHATDQASTDDSGSRDEVATDDLGSGDVDFGDAGDLDPGDTFDV